MENPATWSSTEKIINREYQEWVRNLHKPADERVIGASLARRIADALRKEGLLKED